jgi:serine/threonine protein kinase
MHIKIADFGSAKLLYDTNTTKQSSSGTQGMDGLLWMGFFNFSGGLHYEGARSFVGTAQYVAPELLRSDPTSKE